MISWPPPLCLASCHHRNRVRMRKTEIEPQSILFNTMYVSKGYYAIPGYVVTVRCSLSEFKIKVHKRPMYFTVSPSFQYSEICVSSQAMSRTLRCEIPGRRICLTMWWLSVPHYCAGFSDAYCTSYLSQVRCRWNLESTGHRPRRCECTDFQSVAHHQLHIHLSALKPRCPFYAKRRSV